MLISVPSGVLALDGCCMFIDVKKSDMRGLAPAPSKYMHACHQSL